MIKTSLPLFILLLGMIVASSCQKEMTNPGNNTTPGTETARNILTRSGGWIFNKITAIYGPGNIDDDPLDACKQDDRYYFRSNGEMEVVYGNNACVAGAETTGVYGTWELLNNGAALKQKYTRAMPGGWEIGDEVVWTVTQITDQQLVIQRTVIEPVKTYIVVETYIR